MLAYAAQFVGVVPYGTGNTPSTSFSCDGYTQYVFAGFGISLFLHREVLLPLGAIALLALLPLLIERLTRRHRQGTRHID